MIASLIANRGEIARRIIRTARRMGVRTVAVYSEADAAAPHVLEADQAVAIGASAARESYLDGETILAAAKATGAEAIHPGYGFLSENAGFAEAVSAAGLIWVGPPPSAIRAMGLKDAAKDLMIKAGVPVTPGWLGEDQSDANLAARAEEIGWPVLIKAVAGGGGKGMRRVDQAADFAEALASARREAANAFGDDRVLLEKYAARPRHIEVQVFGDTHGNVVHLFERDCSLQRRHQKVIEEAPAPDMDAATRAALCETAVKAARAVNYVGAGTVEFIADASEGLRADRIWFMEMNTRLQVEHPVTEAITGVDLVEWQLRVASGEALPLSQDQIRLTGHAVEARLYAEDPVRGFLPSTGPLEVFELPEGIRADSAVEQGGEVTAFYDPMIAKLIVHGEDRAAAIDALAAACRDVKVWPVRTNAGFLARCLADEDFRAGRIDTGFIPARLDALTQRPEHAVQPQTACALLYHRPRVDQAVDPSSPWQMASGFRLNRPALETLRVYVDGVGQDARFEWPPTEPWTSPRPGLVVEFAGGEAYEVTLTPPETAAGEGASDGALRAPMPGKVSQAVVKAGDAVTKGQVIVVLEAMKMEHALTAPFDGVAAEVSVREGDQVTEGTVLARIEASA